MNKLPRFINFSLRIAISALLFYSAYSKLVSIDVFELTIVELTNLSFSLSPFISRWIIGLEFILGFYLLLGWELKSKTIPMLILLLVSFSFLMVYMLYQGLNTENCGCFGDKILITPMETIVKNIILILGLVCVSFTKSLYSFKLDKFNSFVFWFLLLSFWLVLFYTNPQVIKNQPFERGTKVALNLDYIKKNSPSIHIEKGKWIIGVISLDCSHCKIATRKLVQYKKMNPHLPIHLLIYGEDKKVYEFVERYQLQSFSYSFTDNFYTIIELIKIPSIPVFYFVEDGYLVKMRRNNDLDFQELNLWK
jgi:hypothetical protein